MSGSIPWHGGHQQTWWMSDFHEDLDLMVQLSLPHSCSHGSTWRFLKAFSTVSPWVRKHTTWEFQGLVAKTYIKKWQWAPSKTQACENEFTVMDWNFVQGESHQCSLVSLRISLESKKDHEKWSILELMSPDNFQRLCHAKSYQSNLQGKWNLQGMFCDKQTVQTCAHTHTHKHCRLKYWVQHCSASFLHAWSCFRAARGTRCISIRSQLKASRPWHVRTAWANGCWAIQEVGPWSRLHLRNPVFFDC